MSNIQFFALLAVIVWLWWIIPRRRHVNADMQKILNCLERIETMLGTNPEAAERLSKLIRED